MLDINLVIAELDKLINGWINDTVLKEKSRKLTSIYKNNIYWGMLDKTINIISSLPNIVNLEMINKLQIAYQNNWKPWAQGKMKLNKHMKNVALVRFTVIIEVFAILD